MGLRYGSFVKQTLPFLKYQSPALLWGLFICLLLLLPGNEAENVTLFGKLPADKVVHFVLFSFFALFARVGWAKWYGKDMRPYRANYFTLYAGTGLAFLTEVMQFFTGYRTFSLQDILADMAGVLFGLLLFLILYKL